MFRIISKGRLRKLSVHQRNRICIICGLSRCSGCSDRCGWSLLYSKWQAEGKIYSTTNYIKNRYGQKLSAYIITSLTGWLCLQNTVHTGRTVLCRQVQKNIFRNTFISIRLRTISSEVIELMIHISHLHRILYPELYHSENFRKQ